MEVVAKEERKRNKGDRVFDGGEGEIRANDLKIADLPGAVPGLPAIFVRPLNIFGRLAAAQKG